MLPSGAMPARIPYERQSDQPSLTYKLDIGQKRISSRIDGLDAIKQAVYKALATERYVYLIYSTDYGSEIRPNPIEIEMERWIKEAVLQDERIRSIDNFSMTRHAENIAVEFTVVSVAGEFVVSQGVN